MKIDDISNLYVYDKCDIIHKEQVQKVSREFTACSLSPLWASSTLRTTSGSRLGNMSCRALRSSSWMHTPPPPTPPLPLVLINYH